jgi:hypothetical protein
MRFGDLDNASYENLTPFWRFCRRTQPLSVPKCPQSFLENRHKISCVEHTLLKGAPSNEHEGRYAHKGTRENRQQYGIPVKSRT